MLQQNRPVSSDRPSLSAPDFSSPAELLDSFVHFLRQQYLVILFTTFLMISLGGTYLIVARPSYTAVATMLIDTRKAQFLQQQPSYSDAQVDSATVESQVRVLKSDVVALSVIKNLQLTQDPEFVDSDAKNAATSDYDRMRSALTVFASRLSVTRDGLSYVIEVSFRSYDSGKAAQIANAVVNAYLVDQLDAEYQSALRASNWLEGRIRELRDQASAAEQAVVDYERENSIVDAAGKTATEQRVGELNTALLVARAEAAEARAKLDRIQTVLTSDSAGAIDATVADTLKNDVVTKLRSQYLDLASKEKDWAVRYGEDHLAVVNLRNQMAEINAAILDEIKQIAGTYKSDFEIANQHADDAEKAYNEAVAQAQQSNQAKVVLNDLKSKAKTYRELYENFLQRYMESVQQQSFPITQARLISTALRPLQKSNPKTLLTLALSTCIGIILGIAIGIFRDLWDRVFRTTEQAEKLLHVPCITLVPALKDGLAPTRVEKSELRYDPLFGTEVRSGSTGTKPDPLLGKTPSSSAITTREPESSNPSRAEDGPAPLPSAESISGSGIASEPASLSTAEGASPSGTESKSDSPPIASPTESEPARVPSAEIVAGSRSDGEPSRLVSTEIPNPPSPDVQPALPLTTETPGSPLSEGQPIPLGSTKIYGASVTGQVNGVSAQVADFPNNGDEQSTVTSTKLLNRRTLVHDDNVLWVAVDSPFSRFAESLRVLKVAVDLSELVRSNKVIGFTSSLPNEGKSTLAAALALQIAQTGGNVILVDCDLRNPSLTETLAPSANAGFIEVISHKASIDDVLWWSDPKINLPFLPSVVKSRVAHTSEILASTATKKLFDELRKRYEYIIVDLSPLAPVVDVRTTAHFVDSYVCVIEWGRTKIDVVKKALADAPGVYQNLIGSVLNKADINKLARYDAHRTKYYSNKHYARYGYVE
jgi:capsular exopolysaccharide synthesis family protein